MKSLKLIGLAFGASLALTASALAQDITVGVAGPMTGGESAFGRQLKNGAELLQRPEIRAAYLEGGRRG